jgi:hypothetical protein
MFIVATALIALCPVEGATPFASARYGVEARLPKGWTILQQEREERVVVLASPGATPERGALVVCEIALAPESLDDYRTRIDARARQGGRGSLARNDLATRTNGQWLDTLFEYPHADGTLDVERTCRTIANRQLYSFVLRCDSETYASVSRDFDALLDSAAFKPPQTGTRLIKNETNRWQQDEFKFAIDLPAGWCPSLAPAVAALLFANGPAHGIWADNCLVLARPFGKESLEELERLLPDRIRGEDPNCEILQCKRTQQGEIEALETIVRTKRGPFSMTVVERRFRGKRFDYEVKYTLESKRFDELIDKMRATFNTFEELPGDVPGAGKAA